ncbi:MAG: hypothetical protein M1831_001958 [Alyxoria varia]|nr:MAG: hypothetical protein M1831_001958 [Alyxoria varia]
MTRLHQQSLGIPLSQFCHAIVHQQTDAPPLLRRRTLNPFRDMLNSTRDALQLSSRPDAFSSNLSSDEFYNSLGYFIGDALSFTAVVIISVVAGIVTIVHFWSRREPHKPVVSLVRNEGDDLKRFIRTSWISVVKKGKWHIFGTLPFDEVGQEEEKLLEAPDEDPGDSDSDAWTIPEDETRVQASLDQLEENDLQENTSKEDREEMSRTLDLKDALRLSGKPQCVVMFRYMTFQQFERRFRCHLNRAQKRPHPFPSYGLYDFTPLGWRGVKDFYKHRKQGQFPKLDNQLLDLRAHFPLPKEYEATMTFEERSTTLPCSKSSNEYSEYLNRGPDTPEKVAQYEEAVQHFSQTFENTEDPIYLFQFDLGMFALSKPTSNDALDGNGDASSRPLEEAQSLWHTVTLGVEADIAHYEGALEFMYDNLIKPDALQLGFPSCGLKTQSLQREPENLYEQQRLDEKGDQSVSNPSQKQPLPNRHGPLRSRLTEIKNASFRKLRT